MFFWRFISWSFWSWSYFNFFVIFPLLVGMESCTSSWTDRANKLEFCRFCIILVVVSMLLFLHNSRFRFFSSLTIFISTHKRPEISAQKKIVEFQWIHRKTSSGARATDEKLKSIFFFPFHFFSFAYLARFRLTNESQMRSICSFPIRLVRRFKLVARPIESEMIISISRPKLALQPKKEFELEKIAALGEERCGWSK